MGFISEEEIMAVKIVKKKGETIRKRVSLKYRNGTPVNLSGYRAVSEMRTEPGGEHITTGLCSVDAAAGIITTTYSASQTALLQVGETYGFDVWIVGANDKYCLQTFIVEITDKYTEA